jgi:hypothetical protein
MKITESKLREVVAEEVAKYIEEQDLNEAPMDTINGGGTSEGMQDAAAEYLERLALAVEKKKASKQEKKGMLAMFAQMLGLEN